MNYRNGKNLLPPKLLSQLQEYVQGELLYVPRKAEKRAGWGAANGSRMKIEIRNIEIGRLYEEGKTVDELMEAYHLSEDSIRKVIGRYRSAVRAKGNL